MVVRDRLCFVGGADCLESVAPWAPAPVPALLWLSDAPGMSVIKINLKRASRLGSGFVASYGCGSLPNSRTWRSSRCNASIANRIGKCHLDIIIVVPRTECWLLLHSFARTGRWRGAPALFRDGEAYSGRA